MVLHCCLNGLCLFLQLHLCPLLKLADCVVLLLQKLLFKLLSRVRVSQSELVDLRLERIYLVQVALGCDGSLLLQLVELSGVVSLQLR